jgi:hypothetical protein
MSKSGSMENFYNRISCSTIVRTCKALHNIIQNSGQILVTRNVGRYKNNVLGCALCKSIISVSHKDHQILSSLSCDIPLDVISIDIRSPGAVTSKYNDKKYSPLVML